MVEVRGPVNYRDLFAQVRQRPGLYGVQNSYRSLTAFVIGVNAGNSWQLLTGFREFLVTRLGYGNNLGWPGLILHLSFPEREGGWGTVLDEPGRDEIAIDTLFRLLDEFLDLDSRPDGHLRIIAAYLSWKKENLR